MNPTRIGCVKYLNARPLIRGWPGAVEFNTPSALCKRLAISELDVALVSSFEFLRNPIYRIVEGVSISSDGPVYSVVLAYRGEFSQMTEIELDPASETSVNLLRCLLAELGLYPHFVRALPGSTGCQPVVASSLPDTASARLLIGDQAIQFRQKHAGEFQFWDLGEQWKKLTGLPFVYALWLIRPEVGDAEQIANSLRVIRDNNMATLEQLISEVVAPRSEPGEGIETSPDFLARYYRQHLRFGFGQGEKQGLQRFATLCVSHGLLPKGDRPFSLV